MFQRQPGTIADKLGTCLTGNEFISSDTHYGHRNIIQYSGRPFGNTHHMNVTLTERWNSVVQPDDVIFFLGDFAFRGRTERKVILSMLNGYKVLVKGNHDDRRRKMQEDGFDEVYVMVTGVFDPDPESTFLPKMATFSMAHVPNPEFASRYDVNLCGHVHEKWAFSEPNFYNVGCDNWDYTPQRIAHIIEHSRAKQKSLPVQNTLRSAWTERDFQLAAKIEEVACAKTDGGSSPE